MYNELDELINDYIAKKQAERGIVSGDIEPFQSLRLDEMLTDLADLIENILEFEEGQKIF